MGYDCCDFDDCHSFVFNTVFVPVKEGNATSEFHRATVVNACISTSSHVVEMLVLTRTLSPVDDVNEVGKGIKLNACR